MKTNKLIIIGVIVCSIIAVSAIVLLEYQSTYDQNCVFKGGKVTEFFSCFKIREDSAGPKIEGKFAQEICSVVGDECPPYYWGNYQEDGSVMVAITSWNANTNAEKSFVFTIKNDILSYTVRENEDYPFGLTGPEMSQQNCNDYVISQWQPRVEDREMVQQFLEICIQRGFLTPDLVERGKVADNFTMGPIQSAQTLAEGDIEKTIEILEEMYGENEN